MFNAGDYVVVRARDAGVHAGEYVSHTGREVLLRNSRRLWRWSAVESISLSAVATFGIKHDGSRIAPVVASLAILDACEIIHCTEVARTSIRLAPVAEQE